MKKRIFSILLAATMLLSLLPISALAVDAVAYVDATGATQSCDSYTQVTDETEDVTWGEGIYVVSGDDLAVVGTVMLEGSVRLILCDGAKLTVTNGIYKNGSGSLEIFGQAGQTGRLAVYNGIICDGVTVNGGIINADGGIWCDNFTLNDGIVDAVGAPGYYSGSGIDASATITVTGGRVRAVGGEGTDDGYGGAGFECTDITVSGGIVEIIAGKGEYMDGYGINPSMGAPGTLEVTGGVVSVISYAPGDALYRDPNSGNGVTVVEPDQDKITVSSDGVSYSDWNGSDDLNGFQAVKFTYPVSVPAVFDLCNGKAPMRGASANTAPAVNPTWGNYVFDGWYTARSGGEEVTADFDGTKTYYAHWWTNAGKTKYVLTEGIAVTDDGVYIGASDTAMPADKLALYGLAYDSSEGKLTMTDAVIDTYDGLWFYTNDMHCNYYAALYAVSPALTVDLAGENTVRLGSGVGDKYGIAANGSLDLTGSELTVACGGSKDDCAYGVCTQGDLDVEADVTVTTGDAFYYSNGVYVDGSGSVLTCCGGAKLTVTSGDVAGEEAYSTGIYSTGNIVNGSADNTDVKIVVRSGKATGESNETYGVSSGNNITNYGKFNVEAGDAPGENCTSYAVFCYYNITNGSEADTTATLNATAGNVGGGSDSYGILTGAGITNYGILYATGGDAGEDGESYGFGTYGGIVNSGILVAGTGNCDEPYGLFSASDSTATGGAVISHGSIASFTGKIIAADGASVTGANEAFTSGETTSLTQSGTEPIVIAFGAVFDPCNGEVLAVGETAPAVDPAWEGHIFDGWFTAETGGSKVTENFAKGTIYYAHWTEETNPSGGGGGGYDGSKMWTDKDVEAKQTGFVDVPADAYYAAPIEWAVSAGIAEGKDAAHFRPDMGATRAQVVTYLWRMAGSPVVNYAMNMTDVPADAYYAEAVRWALANGVTKGMTDTTFSPDKTCTRAQIVALLARYNGVADANAETQFADAKESAYYAAAVNWAVAEGITQGKSATRFAPNAVCTRAQIVTFLYRMQTV